jgi:hypothetical protein
LRWVPAAGIIVLSAEENAPSGISWICLEAADQEVDMKAFALAVNMVLAFLGAFGSISPDRLFFLAREFGNRTGLLVASALRLATGVALVSSAGNSRMPGTVRFFGALCFVTGLIAPFIGVKGFRRILAWWYGLGPFSTRAWAMSILAYGLFMLWALGSPREGAGQEATR